jgi:hypothetical protein
VNDTASSRQAGYKVLSKYYSQARSGRATEHRGKLAIGEQKSLPQVNADDTDRKEMIHRTSCLIAGDRKRQLYPGRAENVGTSPRIGKQKACPAGLWHSFLCEFYTFDRAAGGSHLANKKPCRFIKLHNAFTGSCDSASNITDVLLLWPGAVYRA